MEHQFSVFLSAVSREFGEARDAIADALQARGVLVKVQRSFHQADGTTLAKLHDYIRGCDRVIAVVGDYSGMFPPEGAVPDEFREMLPAGMTRASMTQWEVIFARHYRRDIRFFEAAGFVPEREAAEGDDRAAQAAWRHWLFDGGIGRDRRQFSTAEGLRAEVMELRWPDTGAVRPSNLRGSIGHRFKGRDTFLEDLRRGFRHREAAAITSRAVHGLGGVGKTRAATEYGHVYAADYSATLFLTGNSESVLLDSLAELAGPDVLDLPERDAPDLQVRRAAVIRWFRATPGWLLIIDNADDEAAAAAVRSLLGKIGQGRGHVLITSRVSDWGQMVETVELDLLTPDAAKELLRESTSRRRKESDEEVALARLADEQLGCLSLALVQAAAHIDERGLRFADYGALFDKQAAALLAKLGEAAISKLEYPLPVALTWQASFDQLGDAGKLLLDMLAWLSIEPIPRDLFDVWPDDSIDLEEGLAELVQYSLVRWEEDKSAITLHRLVAQVTRDNLDEAGRDRALKALFPWVYAINPEMNAGDVRCWPRLLPLLPHMLPLFERTKGLGPYEYQTGVYNEYATLLLSLGRFSEAEPLFRSALATDEASLGPDHPVVATRLNNLADFLQTTHRPTEAETMLRRALMIDEAIFGPDDLKVAIRLSNLALSLASTNRQNEAEPLIRRAIAISEASFDRDGPELAVRLNNLAGILQGTGRYTEAEPLFRRAVEIDQSAFGDDHPYTALRLNNLAGLLVDTGRASEAEPHLRRAALVMLRASNANGHIIPQTVVLLRNYAGVLRKMGRTGDDIRTIIEAMMREAGFDPEGLWKLIFEGKA